MGKEAVRFRVPDFTYVMTEATRRDRAGKKYPTDYRVTCAVGVRCWKLPNNPFGVIKPEVENRGWFGLW